MFCHTKAIDSKTILFVNDAGIYISRLATALDAGMDEVRIGYVVLDAMGLPRIVNEVDLEMRQLHADIADAKIALEVHESDDQDEISGLEERFASQGDCLEAISFWQAKLRKLDGYGVNAKVLEHAQKLIARAHTRYVVETVIDESGEFVAKFTDWQTKEYFLQSEATRIAKEHNKRLEDSGATTGYITPVEAYDMVLERYSVPAVKTQRKLAKV